MSEQTTTTHFGYKTVAATEKETLVAGVFHSVAAKYDLMNDLMSFGIHRLWKRFTIDCSGVRKGQKVLDLAGGTGDLTAKFSRIVGETGQVVLADINDSMLKVGRDKLRNLGVANNVSYVQANAEALPFPDNHFDVITIGFGLRNRSGLCLSRASNWLRLVSITAVTMASIGIGDLKTCNRGAGRPRPGSGCRTPPARTRPAPSCPPGSADPGACGWIPPGICSFRCRLRRFRPFSAAI